MLRDVTSVKHLGGHRIWVKFDDGVEGEIDLRGMVSFRGVFEPLLQTEYFAQVRVNPDLGTICWPNEADVDPVVLYASVTGTEIPKYSDDSAAAA
ncbi:MAG: DUF2442 domain-containing protein [Deltaproteobacteria bacterium]|nr:DUF2442 domain-containing protein [Deltaproteobacteria bacterium]